MDSCLRRNDKKGIVSLPSGLWRKRKDGLAMTERKRKQMDTLFWSRLDDLIESSEIIIDRPKGTAHPKYPDLIFPLDYGYLKSTSAMDGNPIDVWRGSAGHLKMTAIACTVDVKKRDTEIKLIIGCTGKEIGVIAKHYSGRYMSCIIVRREPD
jgi:inorganic pyrophosphatase